MSPKTERQQQQRREKISFGDNIVIDISDGIKIKTLIDNLIHNLQNVKNYEIVPLMVYPIFLFFVFADILFLRGIFIWSNSINNKETLSQINFSVYKKSSEIQTQLSEFLTTNKVGGWLRVIHLFAQVPRDPNELLAGVELYRVWEMQSDIQAVMNSLVKLSREIKDYYHLNLNRILLIDNLQEFKEYIEQAESEAVITDKDSTTYQQMSKQIVERIQDTYSKEIEEELKDKRS